MGQAFSNGARAALAADISGTDTQLTVVLSGAVFPTATLGANAVSVASGNPWFKAVVQDDSGFEVVYVRTYAGDTTMSDVLRGQDGTTARAFSTGAIVGLRPLAADMAAIVTALGDLQGKLTASDNLSDLADLETALVNLGLDAVDNTSDASKPVSTAQAAAIAAVSDDIYTKEQTNALVANGLPIYKELLVPAYFDPTDHPTLWGQLNTAAAAGKSVVTAIANVNDGPGASQRADFTSVIGALQAVGGKVLGYILSGTGTRDIALMKADVDNWLSWYPTLDGIFVDEMSVDANATHIQLYEDIYAYIKGKDADLRVVSNPGTNGVEAYMNGTDVMVIFEDTYANLASYAQDAWNAKYPPDAFAMLVTTCTEADMNAALPTVSSMRAHSCYFTDDTGSNPWDTMPSYWTNEVAAVSAATTYAEDTTLKWRVLTQAMYDAMYAHDAETLYLIIG